MKTKKEFSNALLIFVGIGIYFLAMELLGFSDIIYLRTLNAIIVFYGITRTIKSNVQEGKTGYIPNLISAGLTGILGVLFSIGGLLLYLYIRGGNSYVSRLPDVFVFGGKSTVNEYCFALLFEGIASAVILTFLAMQLWGDKTTTGD